VSALAASVTKVRPFPHVVQTVRTLAADPRTSIGDVARVVESDVRIGTDLLRYANAPTSGLVQRCTSVRHAATLLGLGRVVQAVTSAAALNAVEGLAVHRPELGEHLVAVAGVARLLAPVAALSPDEAFTAGLLHDIGMLLLVESDDEFYEGLLELVDEGEEPSPEEERELAGVDHATLGGAVLRKWNLPEPLPAVVELHHDWNAALAAGGTVTAMVALIRVADALAPALMASTEPDLGRIDAMIEEEQAFAYIGLTRNEVFEQWNGLRRACSKAASVASPGSDGGRADAPPARPAAASSPEIVHVVPALVAHVEEEASSSKWAYVALAVGLLITIGIAVLAL